MLNASWRVSPNSITYLSRNEDDINRAEPILKEIQQNLAELRDAAQAKEIDEKLRQFKGLAKRNVKAKDEKTPAKVDAASKELDGLIASLR